MNVQLKKALGEAEAALDDAAQSRLAELIRSAVATWDGETAFSEVELARLKALDAEALVEADAGAVADLFARARG